MQTVTKGVFKEKKLENFQHVEQSWEEFILINNNIYTFKVISIKKINSVENVFADLRGKIKIDDSILEADTNEWN